MNEEKGPQNQRLGYGPQLTRVTRLLRRAQDCLHSADGATPTYAELEEWTGVAERTIKDWCSNRGRPTAEFVLQLLERVPEKQREQVLASAYRVFPTLEHSRLKCDQTIISRLKTMICQRSGLVFIQGGNDESRTFLLTAMGHTFLGLTARPHELVGLDAHEPDWFVPLPGMRYLHNLFQPVELLRVAKESWPKVPVGGSQLVLLNAMSILMGDFQEQIKILSARCPVIIADAAQVKSSVLKHASRGPVDIVTVSQHPENGKGIALALKAL